MQLLRHFGVKVGSHVVQVGAIRAEEVDFSDLDELEEKVLNSEMFCADADATEKMKETVKTTWSDGDSLGGVIEILADGLPVGLGSYTQWDRKLDGKLAQAVLSTQAMKAVEIGDGVGAAGRKGSEVHDAVYPSQSGTLPFTRKTNRAGGLEGGMTNGERLVVRAYMKPIPTLMKGLPSVSYPEFDAHKADYERSDVCAIAAASVVLKCMISITLADAFLDKFSGDSIPELEASVAHYRTQLKRAASTRESN